jgi:hypothetical protein
MQAPNRPVRAAAPGEARSKNLKKNFVWVIQPDLQNGGLSIVYEMGGKNRLVKKCQKILTSVIQPDSRNEALNVVWKRIGAKIL